jgi:hypothetical protein
MPENIEQKRRESKEERKQKIRELGFSKEETIKYLAEHFSTIEKLLGKIQSLQSIGFTNPISLIEKFPQIAGLDINRVIQDLQSIGFTNPISLIEKHPLIAGLDINRIKRRLQLIKRLSLKFQLQFNPKGIVENYPRYLGYDLKRIFFYFRIASFYNVDEKLYRELIGRNPFIVFNILHSLYLENKISDKNEFKRLIYKLKIYSQEARQAVQNETKTNLPQIIENLKQKQNDENARFLLKLANYLEDLLKKEEERKKKT